MVCASVRPRVHELFLMLVNVYFILIVINVSGSFCESNLATVFFLNTGGKCE
jgi:hypothetical protein